MINANEETRRMDATTLSENNQLILRSIHTLSNASRTGVEQVVRLSMFTYRDLQARLESLESHIAWPVSQETFILEDAFGRRRPFSLTLFTSWEMFDTILTELYRKQRGFNRVSRKRYVLRDHRRRREIDHDMPWQSAMLPGSQISMSIICSSQSEPKSGHPLQSCPNCSSTSTEETSEGTRW